METLSLNAILSEDMKELLIALDAYDDFINGRLTCYICGTAIDSENLFSIRMEEDNLLFCCNSPQCVEQIY